MSANGDFRYASIDDFHVAAFVDALAFNWIVIGTDTHAKNYSMLMAPGQVRLVPLYDLNSFLPYTSTGRAAKLSMSIGGTDNGLMIGKAHWLRLARDFGLDEGRLLDRLAALVRTIPDAVSDAAAEGMTRAIRSDLPGRLVDLVAARAAELARRLDDRSAPSAGRTAPSAGAQGRVGPGRPGTGRFDVKSRPASGIAFEPPRD